MKEIPVDDFAQLIYWAKHPKFQETDVESKLITHLAKEVLKDLREGRCRHPSRQFYFDQVMCFALDWIHGKYKT